MSRDEDYAFPCMGRGDYPSQSGMTYRQWLIGQVVSGVVSPARVVADDTEGLLILHVVDTTIRIVDQIMKREG